MNQTEISGNKNKFYIIQLVHPIGNSASCRLFTRWGRVGENGASQFKVNACNIITSSAVYSCPLKGPFDSVTAVNEFKKQFKTKAGTDWENRRGMVAKKGKS